MANVPTSAHNKNAAQEESIIAPYGSWKSPLTADVVSGASKKLCGMAVDGHGRLIWLESRPTESGRVVLVREAEKAGDEPIDITPKEFQVRTLAQEYGGGDFTVSRDIVIFANYSDQRLYMQSLSSLVSIIFLILQTQAIFSFFFRFFQTKISSSRQFFATFDLLRSLWGLQFAPSSFDTNISM